MPILSRIPVAIRPALLAVALHSTSSALPAQNIEHDAAKCMSCLPAADCRPSAWAAGSVATYTRTVSLRTLKGERARRGADVVRGGHVGGANPRNAGGGARSQPLIAWLGESGTSTLDEGRRGRPKSRRASPSSSVELVSRGSLRGVLARCPASSALPRAVSRSGFVPAHVRPSRGPAPRAATAPLGPLRHVPCRASCRCTDLASCTS